ncbi:prostatic acid phosphatase-like isoform X2 [Linepithema humile]|uniref:prostatic acid phosphatase-like isoform X2 n=1 Tax=Linepithema humile TaxID=83485 RepID=UPI00062367D5|nr:PREDICTED: prostatic acid phosphatase-like isoform X2 [Linepithema humile]
MNANVLLIFLSIFAASCSSNENLDLGTIVFANVLYRHGDRTPVTNYPNDPYNETSWPVPYGQLTNIGKHQHLLLGRWLKNRYSHLLSDLYTPHDIYIQSTDVDRTLMSAEANLAGLYPPVQNQIWDSIKWMPIPVHTVPEKQDYVLRASKHCTRYNHELNKVLTSPELEHINKENAKLYAYLTKNSGGKISSLEEVERLYDILYIENLYNKTLPEWTKSVFPDKLKPLAILSFMTETYDKILQKLKSGPLLGEMINHMVKKAQKTLKPDRKVWVYSAHDETVANMLMTLNLFEPHCPPYAATILMELRTNSKNEYFVTVSYKNSTEEPILMTLEGCTTLCPLDKFVNLTKSAVIETLQEWELECLITWDDLTIHNKFWSVMAILVIFMLMLLLLASLVMAFMFWPRKSEQRQYYFRLVTHSYDEVI